MEKEDFRTVDDATRSSYRKRAISLIKQGKKKGEIALMFSVNKNTVSNWWKSYQSRGTKGFVSKKKGVKSEDKKLLSDEQESAVQKILVDKMPEQLKLDFALWTRKAVKELVEGVWYSDSHYDNGRLLTQMGLYSSKTQENGL